MEVITEETEAGKQYSLKESSNSIEGIHSTIAWTGKTPWVTVHEFPRLKLFKTTWENPHPEVEIKSMDFISTSTEASPFLIAITAE